MIGVLIVQAALSGCGTPTQVIIDVSAAPELAERAVTLDFDIYNDERELQRVHVDFEAPGVEWPIHLPLVPRDGDASRSFEVELVLRDGTGANLGRQRVLSGYEPGTLRRLEVRFEQVCSDIECGPMLRCVGGSCESACLPGGLSVPAACGSTCTEDTACPGRRCDDGVCAHHTSCRVARDAGVTDSGLLEIDPDGVGGADPFRTYCEMTADGGGWTLLMKVDGTRSTFLYDSPYWTTDELFHPSDGDLDRTEAKLAGALTLGFSEIRVGLAAGGQTRWLVLDVTAQSLVELFDRDVAVYTSLGRAQWLGLLDGAATQSGCNQEGINIRASCCAGVRIGLIGDEVPGCINPDSWIGLGAINDEVSASCGDEPSRMGPTTGNFSTCGAEAETAAFGYVMVR